MMGAAVVVVVVVAAAAAAAAAAAVVMTRWNRYIDSYFFQHPKSTMKCEYDGYYTFIIIIV